VSHGSRYEGCVPESLLSHCFIVLFQGYTFIATQDGSSFPVTVPYGGVKEGEIFTVPYGSTGDLSTEMTPFAVKEDLGRWKDGLFDCFRFGCFHPHVWNAFLCPQIIMSQVLTRLKLNWLANEAPDHEWKGTFACIFRLVCLYWIVTTLLYWYQYRYTLYQLVSWSFGIYTWLILSKLRHAIRIRYEIPSHSIWDDLCVSLWCGACAVAQMSRQTCDYDQQPAACCSPTGLGKATFPMILTV
jgi:Cys-rich protein (TIGR01571 family)